MKIFSMLISMLIIGTGIGWLTGLSVSPVISAVITGIIGLSLTLVSVLSGLKQAAPSAEPQLPPQLKSNWNLNPVPIALLIIGIVIGTSLGITARTHNLLGNQAAELNVSAEIQKWQELGLEPKELAQRFFDLKYPPPSVSAQIETALQPQNNKTETHNKTVLFFQTNNECRRLLSFKNDDKDFRLELKNTFLEFFNVLPDLIDDPEILKQVVEGQCRQCAKSAQ